MKLRSIYKSVFVKQMVWEDGSTQKVIKMVLLRVI